MIENPEDLYTYYLNLQTKTEYDLEKDTGRSDLGNNDWKDLDCKSGKNPLFNVLTAYSHFDPEIGYCQGMNIMCSWILKHTRTETIGIDRENRIKLQYNESQAFFTFVHLMQKLEYREVYDLELSKLHKILTIIENILISSFPNVYNHIMEEMTLNPVHLFTSMIQTVFVGDLQAKFPKIATHIYDVFLIDGEKVILTLLLKFITLKQDKILELEDENLQRYFRSGLAQECF